MCVCVRKRERERGRGRERERERESPCLCLTDFVCISACSVLMLDNLKNILLLACHDIYRRSMSFERTINLFSPNNKKY